MLINIKTEDEMSEIFSRTKALLGEDCMEKLKNSRIAVFGIGGVGGHTAEALVRSGVGAIDLIDSDTVSLSNINRQIFALQSTVGELKVLAAKKRLLDINPYVCIKTHDIFYLPETRSQFDFKQYDYIIDAVDTVSAKIDIIVNADLAGVPVMSSMGAGNKLDASQFEISDIYKTSVCPLARVMRRELKQRGIKKLKVVYSKEEPKKTEEKMFGENGKPVPGSVAFVPSVAGLLIAGEVISDLIK